MCKQAIRKIRSLISLDAQKKKTSAERANRLLAGRRVRGSCSSGFNFVSHFFFTAARLYIAFVCTVPKRLDLLVRKRTIVFRPRLSSNRPAAFSQPLYTRNAYMTISCRKRKIILTGFSRSRRFSTAREIAQSRCDDARSFAPRP